MKPVAGTSDAAMKAFKANREPFDTFFKNGFKNMGKLLGTEKYDQQCVFSSKYFGMCETD